MRRIIVITFVLCSLLLPRNGQAARVQGCTNGATTTATTITCTFGGNVTANNLVVCSPVTNSTSVTVTLSDTAGNSYAQSSIGYIDHAPTTMRMSTNYGVATTGSFTVVTATWSSSTTARAIACDELSGTATSSPSDGANGQVDSTNARGSVNSAASGSITTTTNGAQIYSAIWDGSGSCNSLSAGTDYTISNNTVCRVYTEYQLQVSAGSVNGQWTPDCCTNTPYLVMIQAFKPSAVGAVRSRLLLGVGK